MPVTDQITILRLTRDASGETQRAADHTRTIRAGLLHDAVPGFFVEGPGPHREFIPAANVQKVSLAPAGSTDGDAGEPEAKRGKGK